jgi:hypothetical protein
MRGSDAQSPCTIEIKGDEKTKIRPGKKKKQNEKMENEQKSTILHPDCIHFCSLREQTWTKLTGRATLRVAHQ